MNSATDSNGFPSENFFDSNWRLIPSNLIRKFRIPIGCPTEYPWYLMTMEILRSFHCESMTVLNLSFRTSCWQCFPGVGKYVTNYVFSSVDDAELRSSKGLWCTGLQLMSWQPISSNDITTTNNTHLMIIIWHVFTQAKKYHGSSWHRW